MALALDAASFNAIAANSAVAFRSWTHEKLGRSDVQVSCVYPLLVCACFFSFCVSFVCFSVKCLCYARYAGPAEAGSRLAQKTMLRFTWQLVAGEFNQSSEVSLRCDNVVRLGVRPPKHWKNELKLGLGLQAFDNLAVAAIQRARDEFGLSESVKLDCRL
jgi:hypothetical protein